MVASWPHIYWAGGVMDTVASSQWGQVTLQWHYSCSSKLGAEEEARNQDTFCSEMCVKAADSQSALLQWGLICCWNIRWFLFSSLCPLPLVLLVGTTENSLASST